LQKSSHRIIEQPFIRAGFAVPEVALLSGFHYIFLAHLQFIETCMQIFSVLFVLSRQINKQKVYENNLL